MFTGLIEALQPLIALRPAAGGAARLVVARPTGWDDLQLGASVCINGVCLTVTELATDSLAFDVVPESLSRSTLGGKRPGDGLNLERSLRADGRFEGHIVQGHVDGVASLAQREDLPGESRLTFQLPPSIMKGCVEKGSIAIDGISLTIAALGEDRVTVALIPTTLRETTLGELPVGGTVNIETDILGKYVARLLSTQQPGSTITADKLREWGY